MQNTLKDYCELDYNRFCLMLKTVTSPLGSYLVQAILAERQMKCTIEHTESGDEKKGGVQVTGSK